MLMRRCLSGVVASRDSRSLLLAAGALFSTLPGAVSRRTMGGRGIIVAGGLAGARGACGPAECGHLKIKEATQDTVHERNI